MRALTPLLAVPLVLLLAGCPEEKCPSGQADCTGTCIDLQSNPLACGACDTPCPAGATCASGQCQCPAGEAICGRACVNLASDPLHCGSCDVACGLGTCTGGACNCDPGTTTCPTPGTVCVDVATDPQNCQVCGRVCPLTNDVCVSGACQCPVGLPDVCAQTCVDKQTDPQNCGTLCSHCATGAMCNAGQCACPAGEDVCGSGTSAACTDRQTDEQNCGTCGNRCATGASCAAGSCACPTSIPVACGGNAGQCCAGNGCCAGSACQTVHANGLGQSYYDCGSLNQHTPAQAQLAAQAWDPTATLLLAPTCGDPNCLCAQGSAKAAIWCYFGSQLDRVGRVLMTPSPNCAAAVCPSTAYGSNWN